MKKEKYCKYYNKGICNFPPEKGESCISNDCEVFEIICPHCNKLIE